MATNSKCKKKSATQGATWSYSIKYMTDFEREISLIDYDFFKL